MNALSNRSQFWAKTKQAARLGFSLVEVTVAMAIMSFASLIILSLIPVGAGALQTAQTANTETEIFGQVKNEIQNTPYSYLTSAYISGFKHLYDLAGQDVTTPVTGSGPPLYTVTLAQNTTAILDGTSSLQATNNKTSQVLSQVITVNIAFHNVVTPMNLLVVNKGY